MATLQRSWGLGQGLGGLGLGEGLGGLGLGEGLGGLGLGEGLGVGMHSPSSQVPPLQGVPSGTKFGMLHIPFLGSQVRNWHSFELGGHFTSF